MSQLAKGPFEVKITPQKADNAQAERSGHGRMSLDKQFHGDLEATSQGEMLSVMTATKGSAAYVAIEKVTGSLGERSGSFAFQHCGTMNRGEPSLTIAVVPDSGTGDLAGISGTMKIAIAPDGGHTYEFEYAFPSGLIGG
ncbi:MAG TPA: DUF3224 domain-containing protein [Polyangiaceae bacterium]|jgi:hypothetical protein|nr:DUF3224 domain-containing protein [Polyangiaceae bacterium]